jgi:hypothetical protein
MSIRPGRLDLGDARADGRFIGDVQHQGAAAQQLEGLGRLGLAHRAEHEVAAGQGRQGDLAPEPAGDTGDQPGLGHVSFQLVTKVVIPDKRSADPGPPEARRSGVGPGSSRCALVRDDNREV